MDSGRSSDCVALGGIPSQRAIATQPPQRPMLEVEASREVTACRTLFAFHTRYPIDQRPSWRWSIFFAQRNRMLRGGVRLSCVRYHDCFLPERHQSALPVLALDSHVRLCQQAPIPCLRKTQASRLPCSTLLGWRRGQKGVNYPALKGGACIQAPPQFRISRKTRLERNAAYMYNSAPEIIVMQSRIIPLVRRR